MAATPAPARFDRPGLPSSVDLAAIGSVDDERFAARFRYPVFAFTFVEVPSGDLSELHAVLGADLREYVQAVTPPG